jgi:hypothetical protein
MGETTDERGQLCEKQNTYAVLVEHINNDHELVDGWAIYNDGNAADLNESLEGALEMYCAHRQRMSDRCT